MRSRLIGASMLAIFVAQASSARVQAQTISGAASASSKGRNGLEEIVVTATKRSERLQRVPLAVQVLDSKTLAQQNVNGFQDYLKLLPSLSTQTLGPNETSVYLRGVSSGDNANHSGPLPTVGTYLDEQPTTTIGGTLDVHVYDIARVEVLPGPQGTLYGASSEAGTVRIITNKPDTSKFSAGYSVEGNTVAHGSEGDVVEGFVNVPITDKIAVRIVGFQEHDSGYIDNVLGSVTFPDTVDQAGNTVPGQTVTNSRLVRKNFNPADTIGGRIALKIDLDENWTITPTIMGQDLRTNGIFAYNPAVGDLQTQRFQPDTNRDKWAQAGLTVNGKIGNFDLTYAGSLFVRDVHQRIDYIDYSVAYSGYTQNYYLDANGNPLTNSEQLQNDKDHFNKVSNELRLASPATDRLRFIVGAYQELQTHHILQDYIIPGLGPQISIPGRPGTIWLTDQQRRDNDYAAFTELSFDVLPNVTITAGVRPYYYDNSLYGFYGFSEGLDNLGYSHTGEGPGAINCQPGKSFGDAPCVNLDKDVTGSGETHKVNLTYRIDDQRMVYFTYSTGYRPGGVNRNGNLPPYAADTLTSYEAGLKSTWFDHRLVLDTAVYNEDWNAFQFSFLGPNSLTEVQNAPAANIKGIETAASFRATDQLTVSGGLTVMDPQLNGNFCGTDQSTGQLVKTCSDAFAISNHGAISSSQLPYTSRVKGNVTARYNFPVASAWDAHVQGGVSFQSSSQVGLRVADKAALGVLPGFVSLDLSAGVEHNDIALELFVKNLADRRAQENRYVECTVGVCTNLYVLPIQPRTIGLRLSQKF